MQSAPFTRYALFYTPPPGPFATAGAEWLGWNSATGKPCPPTRTITDQPRKYGFHGTLKPPFRLASGTTQSDLQDATRDLCNTLSPVALDGLKIARLGGFLALVPIGDTKLLCELAAQVVQTLDPFRAPLGPPEHAKRAKSNLSGSQLENLRRWGYPYVMDHFRFHMTLTGRLPAGQIEQELQSAADHFDGCLPQPFMVSSLTLVGETPQGPFREIERYSLSGHAP